MRECVVAAVVTIWAAWGAAAQSVSVRPPDSRRLRTALTSPLGWRAGIAADVFPGVTFWEAAAKADALGLGSIEGISTQKVSPQIPKNLDYLLSAAEVDAVKSRLAELRMRMPVYRAASLGPDETSRKVFGFAKSLGAEIIVASPEPSSLAAVDRLAEEFGMRVAVEARGEGGAAPALEGRTQYIGLSTRFGEAPSRMQKRVMVVGLRGLGGAGAKGAANYLVELSRSQEPASLVSPAKCTNCSRPLAGLRTVFLRLEPAGGGDPAAELAREADAFDQIIRAPMGDRVGRISRATPITPASEVPAEERQKIEAGLPRQAVVKPKKPRKLLVIDLCPAGGYYHATIAHANLALQLMAQYTKAYEPTFSNDLDNLKYPKIKQFDAVFLNSTVGEVFPDPDVLNGLVRFVREGGGVAGVHGATYASMDLPEFGEMMGAADGPHRVEKATLKIEDAKSPLTRAFGTTEFPYVDEFYHFLPTGPYSREKLHVLVSIDVQKSDMTEWKNLRPDNDFGLSWIREYGKGRVFNCAMGHTPTLFATKPLAEMMLAGIQYVLGDLAADATPSATPAAGR